MAAVRQLAQATANFKVVSGIAKPNDAATLGIFQGLQRALEAARQRRNVAAPAIRADGDIGPTTLQTLRAVASVAAAQPGVGPRLLTLGTATVNVVAANAAELASLLAQVGLVSTDFTPNPAARPPVVPTTPGQVQPLAPPSSPEAEGGGVHWGFWVGGIALLGLAGFLGWRYFGRSGTFAGGDNYGEYDYDEAAGDFIDV